MSRSAKSPCRQAGCGKLLPSPGYCDAHRRAVYKAQKRVVKIDYVERNRFYQRKAWKDARAAQLQREPLCRNHKRLGQLVEGTHVDHVIPIEFGGDPYDKNNLQTMCKPCHEAKTRRDEHLVTPPRAG